MSTSPESNDESVHYKSITDIYVNTRGEEDAKLIVGVYVDDLIMIKSNTKEVNKFKQHIMSKFDMSDLDLLSYYLG